MPALSSDEKEHLASCNLCMHVFKLSLLADRPEDLEDANPQAKAG